MKPLGQSAYGTDPAAVLPEIKNPIMPKVELKPNDVSQPSADTSRESSDEISLFTIGSMLLAQRRLIFATTIFVTTLTVLPALFSPPRFTSSATAISAQNGNAGDSRLQGLAGQFGIRLGGSGGTVTTSPNFLVELARSRVILERILEDTVIAKGIDPSPMSDIADRPKLNRRDGQPNADEKLEKLIPELREVLSVSEVQTLSAVRVSVTTKSSDLSFVIAERLLEELNIFNQELGQSGAREERRFVENRLLEQEAVLRKAESALGAFLQSNRQFKSSPELSFEHDRLQREVDLQQQVLVGLAQTREEARVREVRNTPVISVIEPPIRAVQHDPRKRAQKGLLGVLGGFIVGVVLAIGIGIMREHGNSEDPEAQRFRALLREFLPSMRRPKGKE